MSSPDSVYNIIRNRVGTGELSDRQLRAVAAAISAYLDSYEFKQLVRSITKED